MTEVKFNAKKFAELMTKKDFTDGKLAYVSGVSRSMIHYMRKGERTKVSGEIIAKVVGPLGTSEQYLMDQTDDPSPNQKKMSTLAADIVAMLDGLPTSRQREIEGYTRVLLEIEQNATIGSIYNDLMEKIGRLAEIDGGEKALDKLSDYLGSLSERSSSSPVPRRTRRKSAGESETLDEPSEGGDQP